MSIFECFALSFATVNLMSGNVVIAGICYAAYCFSCAVRD
jgi:hypothetical protein